MYLSEKLREEYQSKLTQSNLKHPEIVGSIYNELESKMFVSDLTYGCVMSLRSMTESQGTVSPFEFFNL
jgi:hypothetical protein